MYRNYAWMNIAGGAVVGGTTGADNGYGKQFAGTNFSFGKELTIGAVLSYDPSIANLMVTQLSNFVGQFRTAQTGLRPVDVFEVTGTYDMGGFTLGAGILYGWAKNDATNPTAPVPPASTSSELSADVFGLRLGVLFDLGGGSAFDASGAIRMDKATDKEDGTPVTLNFGDYSASATEIQVQGRLKLKMSNKVNFIPYVAFGNISGSPKQDAPANGAVAYNGSVNLTAMLLSVGAGMEYKISNFYFAGGVSYRTSHLKSEITPAFTPPAPAVGATTTTNSATEFPVINMGIEWTLLDWLTGRMGYYRTFQSTGTKIERPAGGSTTTIDTWTGNSNVLIGSYAGTDNSLITLGLGLRFGNFALDGTVSDEAIRRGLGLIGAQDNINTFGYVTASYCFD